MGLILLRLLSVAIGFSMLVVPPMLVASNGVVRPGSERAVMLLASMAVGSLGFFLIGLSGNQMDRSPWLRRVAAGLLAIPLVLGALWVWISNSPVIVLAACGLLVVSVLLGLTLVYPVIPIERHRPFHLRH